MKPIYFPFTHVSQPVAQALNTCFKKFIVYRPIEDQMPKQMQFWVEKDILSVRVPVVEGKGELETAVKDFFRWAKLHLDDRGIKAPLLKTRNGFPPFFRRSSSSQIAADIKGQFQPGSTAKIAQPVLTAQIFLYFAQEFDRQNQALNRGLKLYRQKEADMMRQLKMETDSLADEYRGQEMHLPEISSEYMPLGRLEAWSRILLKDPQVSGLFVTHSPAVLEELLNRSPQAEKILQFESIPTCAPASAELAPWQHKLLADLDDMLEHQWTRDSGRWVDQPRFAAAENTVSLIAYLVPNQTPREFFSHCAQIESPDSPMAGDDSRYKNTLIGLVEF
jgi:hypothetical protein